MSERKRRSNETRREAIARSAQAIAERKEMRKERGCNPSHADWQATLEMMLLVMEEHYRDRPGQLVPMDLTGPEEWSFYWEVLEQVDLPPDTYAVLIPPSASKQAASTESFEVQMPKPTAYERNAHSIIVSACQDRTVIMQVSLPGIESVGIDVYKDGDLIGEYSYETIGECLSDLTKVIWTYFRPRGDWTEEQIIRYTESWFAKSIDLMNMEDVKVHTDHSYFHHPELLGLSSLNAAFKLIEATIPRQYTTLQEAIEIANDLNQDLSLGEPTITKEGVLKGKETECQALLNRIIVEIDQHLDTLEYLGRVKIPHRSIRDPEYDRVFDGTARRVYERITGRPCPKPLKT